MRRPGLDHLSWPNQVFCFVLILDCQAKRLVKYIHCKGRIYFWISIIINTFVLGKFQSKFQFQIFFFTMMSLPFFLYLVSPSMQHCSGFVIFDHGHSLFICLVFNSFTSYLPIYIGHRFFFLSLYSIDGIDSALRKMQACVVHPRNDIKPLKVEVTCCERNSNQFTQKYENGRWVDVYQLASSDFQTQLQKEILFLHSFIV